MSSEKKRSLREQEAGQQQRLDLYVIARIITVLKEKGATNRTNLATSTGLAYDKLPRYLVWMNDKKLISTSTEGIISLTGEGLKSYDELVDWIMRYIGRVRFPKV